MKNDQEETADTGDREHRQKQLDEALDDTFPASDPPAVRPNRADPDPVTEGHDEGVPAGGEGDDRGGRSRPDRES
ncbi:MAG TPA: hypothetical protein VK837_05080 [Longimicrobiales bacterium]|nr:hypothetical protein [Longimicrobiales bacterium]